MIKSDFGTVTVCGRKSTVIAELVTKTLREMKEE